MGKISPVSAKYIVHSTISIDGVVDRPDVIGAIFGQTEGLLGADLELRELQRSGRIGRIEVNVDTKSGKTQGAIIIPSSLDKAETCIVGAALEIIQRIGPCNAKIQVQNIEDVRISKRQFVIERAKELLKKMVDSVMPDSQEIADEVSYSVRVMEIVEYGKDRLPAGPAIDESDDIIVVEGRADVLNLLKHGIKNAIAMNGSSVPETIIELSKKKEITVFVDGDRGGLLNVRELLEVAEIDFVTKAPDGKEVEELAQKEIHKALRGRISTEQAKLELASLNTKDAPLRTHLVNRVTSAAARPTFSRVQPSGLPSRVPSAAPLLRTVKSELTPDKVKSFNKMLEDLVGTRGAYILDSKMSILGKVPLSELASTIKSLQTRIHAIVLDGVVDSALIQGIERLDIDYIVAMDSKVKSSDVRAKILTANDL
jgi:DNA primase